MTDLTAIYFKSEKAARKHLEKVRWPDGPVCPHCGTMERITKLKGKSHRPGLYKCNSCSGHFTVTVGTLFERSKIPLHKWFMATYLLCSSKKGCSSHQLHRMLGVTYKTAWFMTHRIREAMKDGPIFKEPMGGAGVTVEADETYIGGKKRGKNIKGRQYGWAEKMKVVALVERGGKVRAFHVDRVTSKSIRKILVTNVDRESDLMTDEAMHYRYVGREYASHGRIHHALGQYAKPGGINTNTVEGFFSIFKRGMKGIYQHCSEGHLHRYLSEFDFRYNTRELTDWERTGNALRGIEGKRLTYGGSAARSHITA
jgi:transposase-like protein